EIANLRPAAPMKTQASVAAAEGNGTAPIKVDAEGGVQANESKTRFIAPVISLMLASRAGDNDAGHHHDAGAWSLGCWDRRCRNLPGTSAWRSVITAWRGRCIRVYSRAAARCNSIRTP